MIRRFATSFALIVVIWMSVFFLPIGNRGLWAPDEPRYTEVAWEMDRAGSLLLPIRNGEIYTQKPPFFFWATIAAAKITGFETASRRVSAVAALITLWIVYTLMGRFRNRRTAFLASMILMSCGLYMWLSGHGNIDVLLTMWTTAAFAAWLMYLDTAHSRWIGLAYVFCGAGVLTKGPVAFVIPWLSFLVFIAYMRAVKKEHLPWAHLIWGWLPVLAITAAWLIPACIAGGEDYTRQILFRQNIGRAVHSFAHRKPFTYYF
ncbi:MAG TPA: glycosyltransferase family 39 protein, partial [bacterium]|nr:glycosyltransferase family 39 protein [bacterium]